MLPNALSRNAIRHTSTSTHADRSRLLLSTPSRTLSTSPVAASLEAKKVLQQHLNPPNRNLLIKNLPPGVTENEVHAILASYGIVESWRPFFNAKKGKHAFITFTEQKAAHAVHDAREHMSVALSVGYFNSKSETETADPTELFVGKLPPSATETAVRAAFSPFGEIESWRPLHRSRHRIWCGFLKFAERRAAEEALAAAEVRIPVTFSVEYALPRHKDAKGLHPRDRRDAATTSV